VTTKVTKDAKGKAGSLQISLISADTVHGIDAFRVGDLAAEGNYEGSEGREGNALNRGERGGWLT
jgi:hypothetical protein